VQALLDPSQLSAHPFRGHRLPSPIHLVGLVNREPHLKHQPRYRVTQFMGAGGDELVASGDPVLQFLGSAGQTPQLRR
jgi:hypothetical protein